jgi:hypothetical protein
MAFKLDIFKLLGMINDPNSGDIYSKLTEDEKKGFAPLVVMRWLSGTKDRAQIVALSNFANRYIFSLGKHPHLLMRLLQACSSKTGGRNYWLATKNGTKSALRNQVLMDYFEYTASEVRAMLVFPSEEQIVQMAEELGWQKDEITKLKKELKDA